MYRPVGLQLRRFGDRGRWHVRLLHLLRRHGYDLDGGGHPDPVDLHGRHRRLCPRCGLGRDPHLGCPGRHVHLPPLRGGQRRHRQVELLLRQRHQSHGDRLVDVLLSGCLRQHLRHGHQPAAAARLPGRGLRQLGDHRSGRHARPRLQQHPECPESCAELDRRLRCRPGDPHGRRRGRCLVRDFLQPERRARCRPPRPRGPVHDVRYGFRYAPHPDLPARQWCQRGARGVHLHHGGPRPA